MNMNEFFEAQLKMWQAQQAWQALVWKNMMNCPWMFWPIPSQDDNHVL